MAKHLHQIWIDSQLSVLLELGIDLMDAQRSINRVLSWLPEGADPATYIPTAEQLDDVAVDSPEAVADARADWYQKVEPRFARLLDAVEEPGDGAS